VRAEWDPLVASGKVPTDFTVKDIPCAESVFADMNPDCPQYVPPKVTNEKPDAGGVDPTKDDARLCYESLGGGQFKFNCKMTNLGTCEDSGWRFHGTYDNVLECASDIPNVAAQIQKGDLSVGPNSREATGEGGVAGSGAAGRPATGGAGGSPSVGACKEQANIDGMPVCLVREISGYDVTGTYKYENGEPIVQLNADGSGLMQYHGCRPVPMHWGVEADASGAPIKVGENERGIWWTLAYRREQVACAENGAGGNYPADTWDLAQLNVRFETNTMVILGEREKPL
jgi:hypothetical protein